MLALMSENIKQAPERPPVGNLTDFVTGVDKNNPLAIEVSVSDEGRVIVFHDKPFKTDISWYEYDLNKSKLDFILDGGEIRDAGMPLAPQISKHMQNTHQILTVLLDDKTGEAKEGAYIPLIIHQK
jgi:hypothetical protein